MKINQNSGNLSDCGCDSMRIDAGVTGERRMSGLESALPPLPEPITTAQVSTGARVGEELRRPVEHPRAPGAQCPPGALQEGCYYMRLIPTALHTPARFQYEGTLRIQRIGGTIIASGDLYINDFCKDPTFCPSLSEEEDRQNNIPVFPRHQYAYYLRVTHIQGDIDTGQDIVLGLEPYRFEHSRQTWAPQEPLTAGIQFATGPDGVHYWRGDIHTRSKIVMGHMMAVWVSPHLRQAVIEIDRVAASECPSKDEHGKAWQTIFKKAGWDIDVQISDQDVEEPEDHSWSNSELHQKMLKYREKVDLDKEWRYHLLAVRELDDKEAFGVMYDNTIKGLNDIPREGAAIASHVMFPNENCWGKCKGKRFGECEDPYFRTAIHEIGHAMMLYHPDNPYENYIMQKSVQIAHNAQKVVPPREFPDNIQWTFSPRDTRLLCHLPDVAVRPGGVSFGTPHYRLPVNARDEVVEAPGLELTVTALRDVVPIGAPVRINFTLTNRSDQDKQVPASLSMKTGHITGRVVDPLGASQEFATIVQYTLDIMPQVLRAGESISHSITMLWGTEGPLFPTSGYYRIIIELGWYLEGVRTRVSGSASVMITPPKDDDHARAALKILSTHDALMAIAIGGDHFKTGYEVIRNAINNPVLRPHYNLIEAKRVGQRYFGRKHNLKETAEIIDKETVMSPTEVLRLAKIVRSFTKETEKQIVEKMLSIILTKAREVGVEEKQKFKKIIEEIQDQLDD